ncbi:ABC transporter permease [bacterium]|nr:MAG: ABC transporter permease [bacterium]
MIGLVLRRLVQLPLILLAIYSVTLTLAWAVPGSPLDKPDGQRPSPAVREAMQRQYNLDSFWRFYFSYLDSASGLRWCREGVNGVSKAASERAVQARVQPPLRPIFDLGPSLQYSDRRVNEIIAAALPVSMTLGAAAMLIATVLGVAAGVVAALRSGTWLDSATLALTLIGVSVPGFVTGTALVLLFGVWLAWFPVGGWGTPTQIILPAFTLSLPFAAYIARLTRMGMMEQLHADYARTARAKGLPEHTVVLRHALRNALLPVVSYIGPATAYAMTGSFVVERIFQVPGMGEHFVNAVLNKDLFLIIGTVLCFGTVLVIFNAAVDVAYRWIDPRIA